MKLQHPTDVTGRVSLSAVFDQAQTPCSPDTAADALLFSGNIHDSVPRALFLDPRLTPLERNAWQVFRMQVSQNGLTAFRTYEELRPFLSSMPCGAKASTETVSRTLTILRLTRWISLVRRRRDARTGRIQGNLYVLHDEPLTPFEAIQLDPEYLTLLCQALTHSSKAIQRVGQNTLQEIAEDPLLKGCVLPNRLQVLAQRLVNQNEFEDILQEKPASSPLIQSYPQHESEAGQNKFEVGEIESEAGEKNLLRNDNADASDSEAGLKPAPHHALPNPKSDSTSTVLFNNNIKVRTVPRAREELAGCYRAADGWPTEPQLRENPPELRLSERFMSLKAEQQQGALVALQQVSLPLQQSVLNEWDARCKASQVRNPAGYLFGIIQKALQGEFKAWASEENDDGRVHSTPHPAPASPHRAAPPNANPVAPRASREVVQAHLTQIRKMLRFRR